MDQPLKRPCDLPDPDSTRNLGARLAAGIAGIPRGWLILLQGQLGSGKSTLARAMLRALGHNGRVPSPTYTLVEPYSFPAFTVYHIDLYRISDPEELEYLGWSDLDDGLRLVEWPERIPGLAEQADLIISLQYKGDGRAAELTGVSERGARLLAGMDLK